MRFQYSKGFIPEFVPCAMPSLKEPSHIALQRAEVRRRARADVPKSGSREEAATASFPRAPDQCRP
jgi:hypothetical protein